MDIDLPTLTRHIQLEVGVDDDGKFGPLTGTAVLAALRGRHPEPGERQAVAHLSEFFRFDSRSEDNLATLDPKAQKAFRRFLSIAKGVAAALGCEYRMISGTRTWSEQDALFNQRPRVTRARGGDSWHNYGIAADFGVFKGRIYLDGGTPAQQELAERVHKAVSIIAPEAGMQWGGSWKSIKDTPHFHLAGFPSSPTDGYRAEFKEKGSVL